MWVKKNLQRKDFTAPGVEDIYSNATSAVDNIYLFVKASSTPSSSAWEATRVWRYLHDTATGFASSKTNCNPSQKSSVNISSAM